MIVFDDKPNKACKPCKPCKNFVAKLALELVVGYGEQGKNDFFYLYVFKFRTILASQR